MKCQNNSQQSRRVWQCRTHRVGSVVAVHVINAHILNSERDTAAISRNSSAHISRRSFLETIRSPSETLISSFHSFSQPFANHHCFPKVGLNSDNEQHVLPPDESRPPTSPLQGSPSKQLPHLAILRRSYLLYGPSYIQLQNLLRKLSGEAL